MRTPGTAARQRAEAELHLTRAQTRYYEELANRLKQLRERNHFGDAIGDVFRRNDEENDK